MHTSPPPQVGELQQVGCDARHDGHSQRAVSAPKKSEADPIDTDHTVHPHLLDHQFMSGEFAAFGLQWFALEFHQALIE